MRVEFFAKIALMSDTALSAAEDAVLDRVLASFETLVASLAASAASLAIMTGGEDLDLAPNPSRHVLSGLLGQKPNKRGRDGRIVLQTSFDKTIHHRVLLQSQPDAAHHVLVSVDT